MENLIKLDGFIDSGEIDVDNTIFLLFTNKRCHSEVLQLLSTSQATEEASKAFDEILKIVSHPSPSIANYLNNFSKSKTDACRLISKFTYIYGSGSAPHDLRESYKLHRLGALEEHLDEIMYENPRMGQRCSNLSSREKTTNHSQSQGFWCSTWRN